MKKSLAGIFKLIDTGSKRYGILITGLLIVSSVLDFFSIAFFLPIISLLIDPLGFEERKFPAFLRELAQTTSVTTVTISFTGAVFLFIVAKSVFQIWVSRKKAHYAYTVGKSLAAKAVDRLLNLSYLSFTSSSVSQEINMIANLPLVISNNIVIAAGTLFSEVIVFMLLLTGVAVYNVKVFTFLVIVMLPMTGIYLARRKLLKKVGTRLRSSYTSMTGNAINLVQGLPDVRAYGKENYFKEKVLAAYENLIWIFGKDHSMQTSTSRLTELIAAWCVCVLIAYALSTGQDTRSTLLLLGIYAGVCFRLIPSVNRILTSLQQIKMHEPSVIEFTGKMNDTILASMEEQVQFQHQITFENVSFSYGSESSVLRNKKGRSYRFHRTVRNRKNNDDATAHAFP
jgi:ATP-binding cassette, subfamily B, bacterial PglK